MLTFNNINLKKASLFRDIIGLENSPLSFSQSQSTINVTVFALVFLLNCTVLS